MRFFEIEVRYPGDANWVVIGTAMRQCNAVCIAQNLLRNKKQNIVATRVVDAKVVWDSEQEGA